MRDDRVLCTHCGTVGEQVRYSDESWLIAFLLLLFFVVPAILYVVYCHSRSYWGCSRCKSRAIIPLSSPMAATLQATMAATSHSVASVVTTAYRQTAEDGKFEGLFAEHYGPMADKHCYAKVAGVTHANSDGTSRQLLISRCETFGQVKLLREPENPADPNAVQVMNQDGALLGYLHKDIAAEIAWDADHLGRVWLAVVRKVTAGDESIPGSLVLCLYRLSEAFVGAQIAKAAQGAGVPQTASVSAMVRTGISVSSMSLPQ